MDPKIDTGDSIEPLSHLEDLKLKKQESQITDAECSSESMDFSSLKALANHLFSEKKYETALEKYNEAELKAVEDKDKGAILHNRGMTYEELQNYESALVEYNKALDLIPDYYKVLKRRVKLYITLEEFEKVKMDLKTLLCLEKKNFGNITLETSTLVSSVLEKLGSAMAIKSMEKIAIERKAPRKEEIGVYFRSFIFDPISLIWKGKEIVPSSVDDKSKYSAALEALKARDYELIFDLCNDEIKNSESEYLYYAYLLRGTMRYLWGYGKETLEDFEAIMNAPKDKRANNKLKSNAALKMALFYLHRTTEGDMIQKYFDMAENLWKENCDVYHHCAMMLVENDSPKNVDVMLTRAAEVYKGADYPVFFQAFGHAIKYCLAAEEQCKETMDAEFSKLQELEPRFDAPECYDVYSNALLLQGNAQEAEALYEKAIKFCPDFPSFHLKKALAHYWDGQDLKACLNDLTKILEIDDQYHVLYFHIGSTELRLGNFENGFQNLRKCIELTRNIDEAAQRATIMLEYETHIDLCNLLGIPPWEMED